MTDKTILLVDDDGDILFHFNNILSNEGYVVESASYGRDAVLKTKEMQFDMAIIDIMLPDTRGDQLAIELRKQNPSIELIFITGFSYMNECIEALDIGISEILIKPISEDELLRSVKSTFTVQYNSRASKQIFIQQNAYL
jgi:DNA-binding response OmpR family regulator